MTRFCSFPGCDNPASPKAAKGLCNSHYWQLHKGRELTPLSYRRNRCVPWLEAHVAYEGDDCLIWPFQRLPDSGMAAVKYRGRQTIASRVMCELAHGAPPSPTHQAAHSCGKGHLGCVSPRHLRWATPKENTADKKEHGTHLYGEAIPWSIATEAQVREIRALKGRTQKQIGERFGLKPDHVGKIIRREIWSHI